MTESDVIKFIVPVFAAVGTPFVCFAGSGLYSLISLFKGNSIFNAGTYGCIVIPPLTYYIASRYGEAIALHSGYDIALLKNLTVTLSYIALKKSES